MNTKTKKLLIFFIGFGVALGGVYSVYSRVQALRFSAWRGGNPSSGPVAEAETPAAPAPRGSLLSRESDIQALVDRDARHGRSPAFVPGSLTDANLKTSIDHLIAQPEVAAANERLREFFPDASPTGFWIRASLALAAAPTDAEVPPEAFEAIGKAYTQILNGEESSVASLEAGLKSLPAEDAATRRQAFRMLSDLGLRSREMRESVKGVLLAEAGRAGSHPDGALAFAALLRINPSKDWAREVGRAYEKLHPGSELSDFVSLNVANL